MKTQKWMVVAVIAVVALMAVMALVPMVLAQGPVVDSYGPAYGNTGSGFRMEPGSMDGSAFGQMARQGGPGYGPGFVDEDGNGVCDNFVDEDGDGVCDHAGTGQGQGSGFVDEDGDGVCDHAGTGNGPGQGAGRGGRMMGRWSQ